MFSVGWIPVTPPWCSGFWCPPPAQRVGALKSAHHSVWLRNRVCAGPSSRSPVTLSVSPLEARKQMSKTGELWLIKMWRLPINGRGLQGGLLLFFHLYPRFYFINYTDWSSDHNRDPSCDWMFVGEVHSGTWVSSLAQVFFTCTDDSVTRVWCWRAVSHLLLLRKAVRGSEKDYPLNGLVLI